MKIIKAIPTLFFVLIIALLSLSAFMLSRYLQSLALILVLIMLLPVTKRFLKKHSILYNQKIHRLSIIFLLALYFFLGTFYRPTIIYRSEEQKQKLMEVYEDLLKEWPKNTESRYIDNKYGKVHVLISGPDTAPPLLMFHATSMSAVSWKENINVLNKNYRCYAIDHIGEGSRSTLRTLNSHPKTEAEQFQLYKDIADSLGVFRSVVIGASNGGRTGLIFASHAPERVEKLILCGPMGIQMPSAGMFARMIFSSMFPFKFVRMHVTHWAMGDSPQVLNKYENWFDLIIRGTLPRSAAPMPILPEQLTKIKAPTLLILGTKDNLTGPADEMIKLAHSIPNLTTKVLDSSHLIAVEKAEEVNSLIKNFLSN